MASKQLKQGVLKQSMIGMRSEKLLSMITSVSFVFHKCCLLSSEFGQEVQWS